MGSSVVAAAPSRDAVDVLLALGTMIAAMAAAVAAWISWRTFENQRTEWKEERAERRRAHFHLSTHEERRNQGIAMASIDTMLVLHNVGEAVAQDVHLDMPDDSHLLFLREGEHTAKEFQPVLWPGHAQTFELWWRVGGAGNRSAKYSVDLTWDDADGHHSETVHFST